jgi:Fic family protein
MRHTDRPDLGGKIRTSQNWIGGNSFNPCGAAFVPPPPELVPDLLNDLVAFLNGDHYPPLVQAALAHAWFETIHPFADGNGRVGRALIHVVLRRRGLAPRYVPPISLVLATRSRQYVDGLTATRYLGSPSDPGALAGILEWINTFTAAASRATNDARELGRRIDRLIETWRARVGTARADSAVAQLLPRLPLAPILTVATASRLIGRSDVATHQAVVRLVEAGVLVQTTVGRRNRVYEAVGLLDLFTSFERALASPDGDTRDSPPVRPVPAPPR